ncbi:MAG: hypothetical protein D6790_15455 [Caldilineae bacterium]|nr:MAG: hypothetical protein D6790_15455 [Caldilineae bacterium]
MRTPQGRIDAAIGFLVGGTMGTAGHVLADRVNKERIKERTTLEGEGAIYLADYKRQRDAAFAWDRLKDDVREQLPEVQQALDAAANDMRVKTARASVRNHKMKAVAAQRIAQAKIDQAVRDVKDTYGEEAAAYLVSQFTKGVKTTVPVEKRQKDTDVTEGVKTAESTIDEKTKKRLDELADEINLIGSEVKELNMMLTLTDDELELELDKGRALARQLAREAARKELASGISEHVVAKRYDLTPEEIDEIKKEVRKDKAISKAVRSEKPVKALLEEARLAVERGEEPPVSKAEYKALLVAERRANPKGFKPTPYERALLNNNSIPIDKEVVTDVLALRERYLQDEAERRKQWPRRGHVVKRGRSTYVVEKRRGRVLTVRTKKGTTRTFDVDDVQATGKKAKRDGDAWVVEGKRYPAPKTKPPKPPKGDTTTKPSKRTTLATRISKLATQLVKKKGDKEVVSLFDDTYASYVVRHVGEGDEDNWYVVLVVPGQQARILSGTADEVVAKAKALGYRIRIKGDGRFYLTDLNGRALPFRKAPLRKRMKKSRLALSHVRRTHLNFIEVRINERKEDAQFHPPDTKDHRNITIDLLVDGFRIPLGDVPWSQNVIKFLLGENPADAIARVRKAVEDFSIDDWRVLGELRLEQLRRASYIGDVHVYKGDELVPARAVAARLKEKKKYKDAKAIKKHLAGAGLFIDKKDAQKLFEHYERRPSSWLDDVEHKSGNAFVEAHQRMMQAFDEGRIMLPIHPHDVDLDFTVYPDTKVQRPIREVFGYRVLGWLMRDTINKKVVEHVIGDFEVSKDNLRRIRRHGNNNLYVVVDHPVTGEPVPYLVHIGKFGDGKFEDGTPLHQWIVDTFLDGGHPELTQILGPNIKLVEENGGLTLMRYGKTVVKEGTADEVKAALRTMTPALNLRDVMSDPAEEARVPLLAKYGVITSDAPAGYDMLAHTASLAIPVGPVPPRLSGAGPRNEKEERIASWLARVFPGIKAEWSNDPKWSEDQDALNQVMALHRAGGMSNTFKLIAEKAPNRLTGKSVVQLESMLKKANTNEPILQFVMEEASKPDVTTKAELLARIADKLNRPVVTLLQPSMINKGEQEVLSYKYYLHYREAEVTGPDRFSLSRYTSYDAPTVVVVPGQRAGTAVERVLWRNMFSKIRPRIVSYPVVLTVHLPGLDFKGEHHELSDGPSLAFIRGGSTSYNGKPAFVAFELQQDSEPQPEDDEHDVFAMPADNKWAKKNAIPVSHIFALFADTDHIPPTQYDPKTDKFIAWYRKSYFSEEEISEEAKQYWEQIIEKYGDIVRTIYRRPDNILEHVTKKERWLSLSLRAIAANAYTAGSEHLIIPVGDTVEKFEAIFYTDEVLDELRLMVARSDNEEPDYELIDKVMQVHQHLRAMRPNRDPVVRFMDRRLLDDAIEAANSDNFSLFATYDIARLFLTTPAHVRYGWMNDFLDAVREHGVNPLGTGVTGNELLQVKENLESNQSVEEKYRRIRRRYDKDIPKLLKKFGWDYRKETLDDGNEYWVIPLNDRVVSEHIMYQKDDKDRIVGQARLKALEVLIDARLAGEDTLPHEYAHHYVAWFREHPLIQKLLADFDGDEEALVDALGKAFAKRFDKGMPEWKQLSKEVFEGIDDKDAVELFELLLDAFTYGYDLYEDKAGPISVERSRALAAQATPPPPRRGPPPPDPDPDEDIDEQDEFDEEAVRERLIEEFFEGLPPNTDESDPAIQRRMEEYVARRLEEERKRHRQQASLGPRNDLEASIQEELSQLFPGIEVEWTENPAWSSDGDTASQRVVSNTTSWVVSAADLLSWTRHFPVVHNRNKTKFFQMLRTRGVPERVIRYLDKKLSLRKSITKKELVYDMLSLLSGGKIDAVVEEDVDSWEVTVRDGEGTVVGTGTVASEEADGRSAMVLTSVLGMPTRAGHGDGAWAIPYVQAMVEHAFDTNHSYLLVPVGDALVAAGELSSAIDYDTALMRWMLNNKVPYQITVGPDGRRYYKILINDATIGRGRLMTRSGKGRIIGQARLRALKIVLDSEHATAETVAHEYAHYYVAWFRNHPVIKKLMEAFGGEEALVERLGQLALGVPADGEAAFGAIASLLNEGLEGADREHLAELVARVFRSGVSLETGALLTKEDVVTLTQREVGAPVTPSMPDIRSDYSYDEAVREVADAFSQLYPGIAIEAHAKPVWVGGPHVYNQRDDKAGIKASLTKLIDPKRTYTMDEVRQLFTKGGWVLKDMEGVGDAISGQRLLEFIDASTAALDRRLELKYAANYSMGRIIAKEQIGDKYLYEIEVPAIARTVALMSRADLGEVGHIARLDFSSGTSAFGEKMIFYKYRNDYYSLSGGLFMNDDGKQYYEAQMTSMYSPSIAVEKQVTPQDLSRKLLDYAPELGEQDWGKPFFDDDYNVKVKTLDGAIITLEEALSDSPDMLAHVRSVIDYVKRKHLSQRTLMEVKQQYVPLLAVRMAMIDAFKRGADYLIVPSVEGDVIKADEPDEFSYEAKMKKELDMALTLPHSDYGAFALETIDKAVNGGSVQRIMEQIVSGRGALVALHIKKMLVPWMKKGYPDSYSALSSLMTPLRALMNEGVDGSLSQAVAQEVSDGHLTADEAKDVETFLYYLIRGDAGFIPKERWEAAIEARRKAFAQDEVHIERVSQATQAARAAMERALLTYAALLDIPIQRRTINGVETLALPVSHHSAYGEMFLKQDEHNRIVGQARLRAMQIVIDSRYAPEDTVAHEYAHFYVAWFRKHPAIQRLIQQYGSEERLVDAIGRRTLDHVGLDPDEAWRRLATLMEGGLSVNEATREELLDIVTTLFQSGWDLESGIGGGIAGTRAAALTQRATGAPVQLRGPPPGARLSRKVPAVNPVMQQAIEQFQQLYPDIDINVTNNPHWASGSDVYNQKITKYRVAAKEVKWRHRLANVVSLLAREHEHIDKDVISKARRKYKTLDKSLFDTLKVLVGGERIPAGELAHRVAFSAWVPLHVVPYSSELSMGLLDKEVTQVREVGDEVLVTLFGGEDSVMLLFPKDFAPDLQPGDRVPIGGAPYASGLLRGTPYHERHAHAWSVMSPVLDGGPIFATIHDEERDALVLAGFMERPAIATKHEQMRQAAIRPLRELAARHGIQVELSGTSLYFHRKRLIGKKTWSFTVFDRIDEEKFRAMGMDRKEARKAARLMRDAMQQVSALMGSEDIFAGRHAHMAIRGLFDLAFQSNMRHVFIPALTDSDKQQLQGKVMGLVFDAEDEGLLQRASQRAVPLDDDIREHYRGEGWEQRLGDDAAFFGDELQTEVGLDPQLSRLIYDVYHLMVKGEASLAARAWVRLHKALISDLDEMQRVSLENWLAIVVPSRYMDKGFSAFARMLQHALEGEPYGIDGAELAGFVQVESENQDKFRKDALDAMRRIQEMEDAWLNYATAYNIPTWQVKVGERTFWAAPVTDATAYQEVFFQKDDKERILGQARIRAMKVIIDRRHAKDDTLAHEYAHHYIAWFRNHPAVAAAIEELGGEEELVQLMGEVITQRFRRGQPRDPAVWDDILRILDEGVDELDEYGRTYIAEMMAEAMLRGYDFETGMAGGISVERSRHLAEQAAMSKGSGRAPPDVFNQKEPRHTDIDLDRIFMETFLEKAPKDAYEIIGERFGIKPYRLAALMSGAKPADSVERDAMRTLDKMLVMQYDERGAQNLASYALGADDTRLGVVDPAALRASYSRALYGAAVAAQREGITLFDFLYQRPDEFFEVVAETFQQITGTPVRDEKGKLTPAGERLRSFVDDRHRPSAIEEEEETEDFATKDRRSDPYLRVGSLVRTALSMVPEADFSQVDPFEQYEVARRIKELGEERERRVRAVLPKVVVMRERLTTTSGATFIRTVYGDGRSVVTPEGRGMGKNFFAPGQEVTKVFGEQVVATEPMPVPVSPALAAIDAWYAKEIEALLPKVHGQERLAQRYGQVGGERFERYANPKDLIYTMLTVIAERGRTILNEDELRSMMAWLADRDASFAWLYQQLFEEEDSVFGQAREDIIKDMLFFLRNTRHYSVMRLDMQTSYEKAGLVEEISATFKVPVFLRRLRHQLRPDRVPLMRAMLAPGGMVIHDAYQQYVAEYNEQNNSRGYGAEAAMYAARKIDELAWNGTLFAEESVPQWWLDEYPEDNKVEAWHTVLAWKLTGNRNLRNKVAMLGMGNPDAVLQMVEERGDPADGIGLANLYERVGEVRKQVRSDALKQLTPQQLYDLMRELGLPFTRRFIDYVHREATLSARGDKGMITWAEVGNVLNATLEYLNKPDEATLPLSNYRRHKPARRLLKLMRMFEFGFIEMSHYNEDGNIEHSFHTPSHLMVFLDHKTEELAKAVLPSGPLGVFFPNHTFRYDDPVHHLVLGYLLSLSKAPIYGGNGAKYANMSEREFIKALLTLNGLGWAAPGIPSDSSSLPIFEAPQLQKPDAKSDPDDPFSYFWVIDRQVQEGEAEALGLVVDGDQLKDRRVSVGAVMKAIIRGEKELRQAGIIGEQSLLPGLTSDSDEAIRKWFKERLDRLRRQVTRNKYLGIVNEDGTLVTPYGADYKRAMELQERFAKWLNSLGEEQRKELVHRFQEYLIQRNDAMPLGAVGETLILTRGLDREVGEKLSSKQRGAFYRMQDQLTPQVEAILRQHSALPRLVWNERLPLIIRKTLNPAVVVSSQDVWGTLVRSVFMGHPSLTKDDVDLTKRAKRLTTPGYYLEPTAMDHHEFGFAIMEEDVVDESEVADLVGDEETRNYLVLNLKEVEATDGAGFINLARVRDVYKGLRRWSSEMEEWYQQVIHWDDLDEEQRLLLRRQAERRFPHLMQSIKPHYSGRIVHDGQAKEVFIKYSEIPVMPWAEGEQRRILDALNRVAGAPDKPALVVPPSSVKMKIQGIEPQPLDELERHATLPYTYYKTVQSVGFKLRQGHILNNVQQRKITREVARRFGLLALFDGIVLARQRKNADDIVQRLMDSDIHADAARMLARTGKGQREIAYLEAKLTPLLPPLKDVFTNMYFRGLTKRRDARYEVAGFSVPIMPSVMSPGPRPRIYKEGDRIVVEAYLPLVDERLRQAQQPGGDLDISALGPLGELLTFRIPAEEKYSVIVVRPIGFLEGNMILPDALVGIIGHDFDIDKMYAYLPPYKVERGRVLHLNLRLFAKTPAGTIDEATKKKVGAKALALLDQLEEDRFIGEPVPPMPLLTELVTSLGRTMPSMVATTDEGRLTIQKLMRLETKLMEALYGQSMYTDEEPTLDDLKALLHAPYNNLTPDVLDAAYFYLNRYLMQRVADESLAGISFTRLEQLTDKFFGTPSLPINSTAHVAFHRMLSLGAKDLTGMVNAYRGALYLMPFKDKPRMRYRRDGFPERIQDEVIDREEIFDTFAQLQAAIVDGAKNMLPGRWGLTKENSQIFFYMAMHMNVEDLLQSWARWRGVFSKIEDMHPVIKAGIAEWLNEKKRQNPTGTMRLAADYVKANLPGYKVEDVARAMGFMNEASDFMTEIFMYREPEAGWHMRDVVTEYTVSQKRLFRTMEDLVRASTDEGAKVEGDALGVGQKHIYQYVGYHFTKALGHNTEFEVLFPASGLSQPVFYGEADIDIILKPPKSEAIRELVEVFNPTFDGFTIRFYPDRLIVEDALRAGEIMGKVDELLMNGSEEERKWLVHVLAQNFILSLGKFRPDSISAFVPPSFYKMPVWRAAGIHTLRLAALAHDEFGKKMFRMNADFLTQRMLGKHQHEVKGSKELVSLDQFFKEGYKDYQILMLEYGKEDDLIMPDACPF